MARGVDAVPRRRRGHQALDVLAEAHRAGAAIDVQSGGRAGDAPAARPAAAGVVVSGGGRRRLRRRLARQAIGDAVRRKEVVSRGAGGRRHAKRRGDDGVHGKEDGQRSQGSVVTGAAHVPHLARSRANEATRSRNASRRSVLLLRSALHARPSCIARRRPLCARSCGLRQGRTLRARHSRAPDDERGRRDVEPPRRARTRRLRRRSRRPQWWRRRLRLQLRARPCAGPAASDHALRVRAAVVTPERV